MADANKVGTAEDWQPLCDLLKEKIVAKIAEQDHNATGALSQSVEVIARELPDRWVIEALANNYGVYVNNGRRQGAPMPPISVIYQWMQQRGIGANLAKDYQKRGLAYVISKSIAEKGIPPQGGYSDYYSKGNSIKRTGFADDVIAENEEQIWAMVEEVIGKVTDWIIFNKYRKTAKFIGQNGN